MDAILAGRGQGALWDWTVGDLGAQPGGRSPREGVSVSSALSPYNPSHVLTVTEPSGGNRRWRCPNVGLEYPPFPEMGTRGSKQGGGILAALPRGPVGLRHQVSLSVSSCSHPGEAPVGRGERKRGRAPAFREPLPKPQRVPRWREGRPSPPHPLSSRTGKRVCGRGGAGPDRGPGMGGHGRARGRPSPRL